TTSPRSASGCRAWRATATRTKSSQCARRRVASDRRKLSSRTVAFTQVTRRGPLGLTPRRFARDVFVAHCAAALEGVEVVGDDGARLLGVASAHQDLPPVGRPPVA